MVAAARALLFSLTFLCALRDALQSRRGHCAGGRCVIAVSQAADHAAAQRHCRDYGGELLATSEDELQTVMGALQESGRRYWLELRGVAWPAEGAAAGQDSCATVSVPPGGFAVLRQQLCHSEMDGFLCQYAFRDPCSRLHALGDAHVEYTTYRGFDVSLSETFPPGTIAVAVKAGGRYAHSKHVCVSEGWLRAPWNCEVMLGGCEHDCNSTTRTCMCPAGQQLHHNNITCSTDPCDACGQMCERQGDAFQCACVSGYRLAQDGKRCVDVNECEGQEPCAQEGEECINTEGGYECACRDGFAKEDGKCVVFASCDECEHLLCERTRGVSACVCRKGFKVSATDPTKCELHCADSVCPAQCDPNNSNDCRCPRGYLTDTRNTTVMCVDMDECELGWCDQQCEDELGGYRCWCNEGYELVDQHKCVPLEEGKGKEEGEGKGEGEEGGSGSPPPLPTAVSSHPAAVPSYVKTGSVLGIGVFVALCAALLCAAVRYSVKRCGSFQLVSFRHPDIDVFYLQQVTTETYKRLSFDRQFKNDLQRL